MKQIRTNIDLWINEVEVKMEDASIAEAVYIHHGLFYAHLYQHSWYSYQFVFNSVEQS
jgi:hypothetical protein